MNADELTDLVQRAREAEGPPSRPPVDLLDRARSSARGRRATLLAGLVAAAVVAVAVVVSSVQRPSASGPAAPRPTRTTTSPAAGTRLVGAHGIVVAVPRAWRTAVEQGDYCLPTTPDTVQFYLPATAGIGSCGVPDGGPWPAPGTLAVYALPSQVRPGTAPAGTVGGMPYYERPVHQTGAGVARALLVPRARVQFVVGAATTAAAQRLLETVRSVPAGSTTVAVTATAAAVRGVLQVTPALEPDPEVPVRSRVIEVAGGGPGEPPGVLLRTDPPIGTPVPAGSTVTLVLSAGDLSYDVTPAAFAAAGWDVTAATTFDPPITRERALAVGDPPGSDGSSAGGDGAYLRRLDGRLVWLVLKGPEVTAVDAHSGRIVRRQVFTRAQG